MVDRCRTVGTLSASIGAAVCATGIGLGVRDVHAQEHRAIPATSRPSIAAVQPLPAHASSPAASLTPRPKHPSVTPTVPQRTSAAQTPPAQAADPNAFPERAVLSKYCVTCHNQRRKTAGLALDQVDAPAAGTHGAVWEKVVRKLRAGAMPPPGSPRPDQATYDTVATSLETTLDRIAGQQVNPGRTEALHRLTRVQYRNAIRDLLDIDIEGAQFLPADAADRNGFDNMSSVLSVSPVLLDRYVSAAHKISRLAVGLPPLGPAVDSYTVPITLLQDDRGSEDSPFGSRGGPTVRHNFPVNGEYEIKINIQPNYVGYLRGMLSKHQLELRVDGVRVKAFTIGGEAPGRPAPASYEGNIFGSVEWEDYMHNADKDLRVRIPLSAGPHVIGVAFPREAWAAEGVVQPRAYGFALAIDAMPDSSPGLGGIDITGPLSQTGPGDTPSRRRIFTCRPTSAADEAACAEKILSSLARLAYRRPVSDADRRVLRQFYESGRAKGDFDSGIQAGLERILSAPDFLFRIERDPASVTPGRAYRLTGIELASRLAFFLWSSLPDEPLLQAATTGRLDDPKGLTAQVQRMLADRRSSALLDNFFGQWLALREVKNATPDPVTYPEFDDSLREAFERETQLFIESQLREDRGIPELVTANYTFLNARLARHYGIPGVYGSRYRKVTVPNANQRGGLLGQGSTLLVTSYPNRTSPVLRGKWLLTNILGAAPPPPPEDVPALPERGEGGKPASVRELLETHRKNAVCATCHSQMDPLGFALDHFDGIGTWRERGEGGAPVDATAVLSSGTKFEGLGGLRSVLEGRREQFVRTVSEKLLSYALGREADYFDMPAIRQITRTSAASGYKWSSVISGIVQSAPFRMRKAAESESAVASNPVERPQGSLRAEAKSEEAARGIGAPAGVRAGVRGAAPINR